MKEQQKLSSVLAKLSPNKKLLWLSDLVVQIQFENQISFFIPCHMLVPGNYGITLAVHVSVHLSVHPSFLHLSICQYFRIWMITGVNINGVSPNLVYALIL